jgi:hypothetical protein
MTQWIITTGNCNCYVQQADVIAVQTVALSLAQLKSAVDAPFLLFIRDVLSSMTDQRKTKLKRNTSTSPPPVHLLSRRSTPHPPSQSPLDTFWANPPIYASVSRVVSFLLVFPPKPCTIFSPFTCVPHARQPHSPWFDLPDDIWGLVQMTKLPIVHNSNPTKNKTPQITYHNDNKPTRTVLLPLFQNSCCSAWRKRHFMQSLPTGSQKVPLVQRADIKYLINSGFWTPVHVLQRSVGCFRTPTITNIRCNYE